MLGTVLMLTMGLTVLGTANWPAGATFGGNECYQDEVMIEPGPTSLKSHGSTHFAHAFTGATDEGSGTFTWDMQAIITGANTNNTPTNGDLDGFLTASIDWDNASKADVTFQSSYVLEVHTSPGFLDLARYQGSATFFPSTAVRPRKERGPRSAQ